MEVDILANEVQYIGLQGAYTSLQCTQHRLTMEIATTIDAFVSSS